MKQALISLIFCCMLLSANSQVFLRQEILNNLKKDNYDECKKLLENNSILISENNLINNKELFILYLLNDSLITTNNDFWKLKGYYSDSLTNYLFEKMSNEIEIFEKKVEQLSSNKAEKDFNNLFLEQIFAPKDEQTFSKKEFTSYKKHLLNYYRKNIDSCPDSLYTKFGSLKIRKESKAIYLTGAYYQTASANSIQNISIKYGIGVGISRTIGMFTYDYGLNLNNMESKTFIFSPGYGQPSYYKPESIVRLGWNTSLGINMLNNQRISLSTMFHINSASFENSNYYVSVGIKSDLTVKFPKAKKAYHTTDGFMTGGNCVILSAGYTWGTIENYFISISYGLNMDVLRKKFVMPRK